MAAQVKVKENFPNKGQALGEGDSVVIRTTLDFERLIQIDEQNSRIDR
jgi:hypothetical protein